MEMWTDDKLPDAYKDDWKLGQKWIGEELEQGRMFPENVVSPKGGTSTSPKLPDVTKLNSLMRARWLVSRRRTKNLFDLTNLWKRIVLSNVDNYLFDEVNRYNPIEPVAAVIPQVSERALGKRRAPDGEMPPAKKVRPRAELPNSSARTHSGWAPKDVRTSRKNAKGIADGTSGVIIGPSAPRGFITHWLTKKSSRQ